jgi:hypothetical protein
VPIPIGPSVGDLLLALGNSHSVVKVLDDTLDKVLSELEVTEVVERREKLEVLHEPCLNRKELINIILREAHSLNPSLCLAECAEHFQIPIREGVFDALLGEDGIVRSHIVPLSSVCQPVLSKQ